MFDARNTASGVVVYSVPRPKISGLSMAQANGMRRRTMTESVMSPKPMCQPVKTSGGGLPASMVIAKGLPGHHRRRSPKMGPRNRVCVNRIPTQHEYDHKMGSGKLRGLRSLYLRIVNNGTRVNERLDALYERARQSFMKFHTGRGHEVIAMERQVEATAA